MRVLIKVSGMHLYKIPFQCNIHSKLQTRSYFFFFILCFLDKHSGSKATKGTIPPPVLIKGLVSEDEIPQELFHQPRSPHYLHTPWEWEYGSSHLLLPPGFLLLSCTRKHRGNDSTGLGTRGRGTHTCSSCSCCASFTATVKFRVIPHNLLTSSHIRANWQGKQDSGNT